MKKFKVEFDYQDRNACGLKFKHAKRTVKANSEEDAVRKLEQALTTTIINPKFIEVVEEPKTEGQTEATAEETKTTAETEIATEPETATDPETAETEETTDPEVGKFVYDVRIHNAYGWDTYTVRADGLKSAEYKAVRRMENETDEEEYSSIDVIRIYKEGTDELLKEIIVEENGGKSNNISKEREEPETAEPKPEEQATEEPTAEKQATAEETADKGETTENGFNYKREIVLSGNSQILKNWAELTGISADEFLEALEWVCNDPLTEWGRITRKIGLTENGIVKLDVVRTKAYTALYHNGRLWRGGFFNIPCPKEYKDFSKDGKTIRVAQKITLSCKDRV